LISKIYKTFLFLLFSATTLTLLGQSQQDQTPRIVELKDGSRLLGTIIEDNDYAVTIAILTGDTLEIGYKYISAVGPLDDSRVARRGAVTKPIIPPKTFIDKDLIKVISVGFTFGDEGSGGFLASFDVIKMLNDRFGVGGGFSYTTHRRFIGFERIDLSILPLHASLRYVFKESKTLKPFVQLDLGYGIGIDTERFDFNSEYDFNGGIYSQLHFGTTLANRQNYNMQLSLNLLYQNTSGNIRGFDFNLREPFESNFDLDLIRPGFTIAVVF